MSDLLFLIEDGTSLDLLNLGTKLVLFFYPKDNTPGCTIENKDFALLYNEFKLLGYEVIGVSKDSIASHCRFKDKYSLPFKLISDVNGVLCNKFSVINKKTLYGKIFMGIERSTFLLNEKFEIIQEWRKVSSKNHANFILEFIKSNNF